MTKQELVAENDRLRAENARLRAFIDALDNEDGLSDVIKLRALRVLAGKENKQPTE